MILAPRSIALIGLIVGAAAFSGGYKVADWRLTGRYAAEKLKDAATAAKTLADMTAERDALSARLSAANDLHTENLRIAQNETARLRDRIASNSGRLRIAATCPPAATSPQTAAGPGVGVSSSAELNETARRAYFALRDGIDRAGAQLAACQEELKLRTLGGNKSP